MAKKKQAAVTEAEKETAHLDAPSFSSRDSISVYFDGDSERKTLELFDKVKGKLEPFLQDGDSLEIRKEFMRIFDGKEQLRWAESWTLAVSKPYFSEKEAKKNSAKDKALVKEAMVNVVLYAKRLKILKDALTDLGYDIDYLLPDSRSVTCMLESKLCELLDWRLGVI